MGEYALAEFAPDVGLKFANGQYLITRDYDLNLRNKIEAFKLATDCRESIQLVMITTYGIKINEYSSVVQNQITLDDLFYFEQ